MTALLYLSLAAYAFAAVIISYYAVKTWRVCLDIRRINRELELERLRGYSLSTHYRSKPRWMKQGGAK
jgi:hypothetical protein